MKRILLPFALVLALLAPPASWAGSDAEADWQAVVALDAGPKDPIASREDARKVALEFLVRQEAALREFLEKHPADAHAVEAQLRLAHLLATRSDLIGNAAPYEAALQLLDAALKTAPEERRADLAFARIALAMHRAALPTDADRVALTTQMIAFQKHYPNDRRLAELMAEIATLYDNQPKHKEILLKQAFQAARTDETRARISDDLKRLALLGRPVTVQGATAEGLAVDAAQFRGKVVLVYFFAGWSPPSLAGFQEVAYLRKTFSAQQLGIIGVSLDPTREALASTLKDREKTGTGLNGQVIWDGKVWESPLVRGLGINALPTLWILDKRGNLRTLNAQTESETLVRSLLKEAP